MCVIIYEKRNNDKINLSELKTGFENNPDGAGYCIKKEDGTLEIKKGFMDFKSFMASYGNEDHRNEKLIHFRISTSGLVNMSNCHPFYCDNGRKMALAHNGILPVGFPRSAKKSDTRKLATSIMPSLINKLGNTSVRFLLKQAIGTNNKLVIMKQGKENETYIVNKDQGTTIDGVWFSNTTCHAARYVYNPAYNTYQSGTYRTLWPETKQTRKVEKKEKKNNPAIEVDEIELDHLHLLDVDKKTYYTQHQLNMIYLDYPECVSMDCYEMEDYLNKSDPIRFNYNDHGRMEIGERCF